jgi:hypothetical protein
VIPFLIQAAHVIGHSASVFALPAAQAGLELLLETCSATIAHNDTADQQCLISSKTTSAKALNKYNKR